MSLSDCPRCWNSPCTCGHEYQTLSLAEKVELSRHIFQSKDGLALLTYPLIEEVLNNTTCDSDSANEFKAQVRRTLEQKMVQQLAKVPYVRRLSILSCVGPEDSQDACVSNWLRKVPKEFPDSVLLAAIEQAAGFDFANNPEQQSQVLNCITQYKQPGIR